MNYSPDLGNSGDRFLKKQDVIEMLPVVWNTPDSELYFQIAKALYYEDLACGTDICSLYAEVRGYFVIELFHAVEERRN